MNRFLKKIIFLQSANIPKAEINLDGNIQILGGNSTGKTTIQKAIMFFYNASPTKLGLVKGQKSFIDFYYPYSNSMIIYELEGETPFFVVTRVHDSRVVYYFVDSEYREQWFINEKGELFENWSIIKKNIQEEDASIYISPEIDTYKKFKDIIGGNMGVERELRRFFLVKSKKYSSIANVIQNVYLCKELDIEIIKDIIIDSAIPQADNSENNERLMLYRSILETFEKNYKDLLVWKKNKELLNSILSSYNKNEQLGLNLIGTIKKWNFSYKSQKQLLPILKKDSEILSETVESDNRIYKEEEEKFKKENDLLSNDIQKIKINLEKAEDIKANAKKDNIEQKIIAMQGLQVKKNDLGKLQHQLSILEKKYEDEKQRFDDLIKDIKARTATKCNSCDKEINEIEKSFMQERDGKMKEKNAILEKLMAKMSVDIDKIECEISEMVHSIAKISSKLETIDDVNPYKEKFQEIDIALQECNANINKLELEKNNQENLLRNLRTEAQYKIDGIDSRIKTLKFEYNREKETLLKKEEMLQNKINSIKGSFMEWLDDNVEGWENNIGKIVDEDSVIYNGDLCPEITEDTSNTLYGIKINTDGLNRKFKTPNELQSEKEFIMNEIQSLKKNFESRKTELESERRKEEESKNNQILNENKKLNGIKTNIQSNLSSLTSEHNRKRKLESQLSLWHSQKKDELTAQKSVLDTKLIALRNHLQEVKTESQNKRNEILTSYEKVISEMENDKNKKILLLQKQKKDIESSSKKEIESLTKSFRNEAKNKGVDQDMIDKVNFSIHDMEEQIRIIEGYKDEIAVYNSNKVLYIDKIESWKYQLDSLKLESDEKNKAFDRKKKELTNRMVENRKKINENDKRYNDINKKLAQCGGMLENSNIPELKTVVEEEETDEDCLSLLKKISGFKNKIDENQKGIRENILTFMDDLNPIDNMFGFKSIGTGVEEDKAIKDFVLKLDDLMFNNAEESYEKSLFKEFSDIPLELSRYVGQIYSKRSEIKKIVDTINRDFLAYNFVDKIKEMKFIVTPSKDPLVNHLLEMQRWWEEHQNQVGGVGLFAQDTDNYIVKETIKQLRDIKDLLDREEDKKDIYIKDTFGLEINITENDNKNKFSENVTQVGSTGINTTAKAMIFILLINAFKKKASNGDNFFIHCLYDEILNIDNNNIAGILDFANKRNIRIITAGPSAKLSTKYKYSYILHKDNNHKTHVMNYHKSNNI